jgi:hypothetical protein
MPFGSVVGISRANKVKIEIDYRVPAKKFSRFESLRLISAFSFMSKVFDFSSFPLQKFWA